MSQVKVLGVDLAKNSFQLHGVCAQDVTVLKKKISRSKLLEYIANLSPCLIGLEACSSSHYWARKFREYGHEVKQMSPQYVKPYVKTNKNDAADAEAICEAVTRKNMRFVPNKSIEAQDLQAIHRARKRLVRSSTSIINETRGFLMEYGIIIAQSKSNFSKSIPNLLESDALTSSFKETLRDLYDEYSFIQQKIKKYDQRINIEYKNNKKSQKLGQIKGVGPLVATALLTTDPTIFKNGRQFAAWLGLTPAQYSTGGKDKLLGISKRGDKYLRELLVHGARIFLRWSDKNEDRLSVWARNLRAKKGHNIACVAVANKLARISWAMMVKDEDYKTI